MIVRINDLFPSFKVLLGFGTTQFDSLKTFSASSSGSTVVHASIIRAFSAEVKRACQLFRGSGRTFRGPPG
eukprot:COSAG01_NODE_37908_length_497_cov_0.907035_2_plen_70_part_01